MRGEKMSNAVPPKCYYRETKQFESCSNLLAGIVGIIPGRTALQVCLRITKGMRLSRKSNLIPVAFINYLKSLKQL